MKLGPKYWVAWLGATVVAAVSFVAYAYTNFQTKDEAKTYAGSIEQRLDRIENKQDRIENKQDQMLFMMKSDR